MSEQQPQEIPAVAGTDETAPAGAETPVVETASGPQATEAAVADEPAAQTEPPVVEQAPDTEVAGTDGPAGADGSAATLAEAAAVAEPAAPVVDAQLKAIVEALIFASPDPLTMKALAKVLDGESPEALAIAVASLEQDYAGEGGLQLVQVAGGYQIVTRPDLHEWVRRLFHERTTQKLSVAALETLAVIAYKQPITAAEIAEVRGVNTSGVLGTLIDRKLVKIVGRKQVVGRPFMYATTREFLNRFGLRDLNDLPKVEDMADALGFEPPMLDEVATATLPFDEGDAVALAPPAETASVEAGTPPPADDEVPS